MDVEEKQDHSPLCDSGFAEADRGSVFSVTKTSANISHHSLSIVDNIDNSKRLPNLEPYLSVVPGDNLSSSHDFGDYVDITLDYEKTPPLPKRLYRENEYISDQNPESPQITSVKVVTETEIYVREQPIEVPRERSNDSKQNSIPNETHDLTKPECELKSITFPGILHKSSDNSKQETIESTEIKKPEYEPGCTTTVGILHNSSDNSDKKTIKSTEIKPEFELKCMTTTELAELLKTCKLEKFANVCIEEVIDGDLFLSLTDDILQEEPFKLKKLDILKVNKIRDGWRPK